MILKKIYYHQLQHLEHYQFTSHLLTMSKEANVAKLTAVLKPLEDAFKPGGSGQGSATVTPKE